MKYLQERLLPSPSPPPPLHETLSCKSSIIKVDRYQDSKAFLFFYYYFFLVEEEMISILVPRPWEGGNGQGTTLDTIGQLFLNETLVLQEGIN